jgi:hypothetical protein
LDGWVEGQEASLKIHSFLIDLGKQSVIDLAVVEVEWGLEIQYPPGKIHARVTVQL